MSYKHHPETDKTTLPSRILGLKGNIWRVSGLGYSGLFMFSSSSSTTFATLPAVIWTTCLRTRSWNGEIENEKPTKCPVHLAKTLISLCICEVWSVFAVRMKRRSDSWIVSICVFFYFLPSYELSGYALYPVEIHTQKNIADMVLVGCVGVLRPFGTF